jgi:5-methylcytosine-specific restriction endonuclease McrA
MRRFRSIERLLERDELTLSSVSMIASILNESNVEDILGKIRGKSRREIEVLVANYRPPVKLRDRVQPVRVVMPEEIPAAVHSRRGSVEAIEKPADTSPMWASADATPATRTETRLWIQFLASQTFMAKYHEASALLSNRIAKPSLEAVFEELLDEFLKRRAPREREARRERRLSRSTTPASAKNEQRLAIPAKTRDAVFVRDQGRCTYVGSNGRRCNEMHNVHVDHITPVARNGTSDATNLRLLCARHNQFEAERVLGKTLMDRYRVT